MQCKNLFDGESYKAEFANIAYRWLMSRRWVTYADILAEYLGLDSSAGLEYSVSKYYEYTKDDNARVKGIRELKKAFPEVCNAIKDRVGMDSIEEDGNNRNKRFRYIGKDNNPLYDMLNAKAINNLHQYWQFCQDSAGFFPASWLEYFFKDCRDLLEIKSKKRKGEQVLSVSLDRMLNNIDLLPFLYESIIHKQVLSVDYKPFEEEERTLTFHPQYLKEFNGRWHLFGHAQDQTPEFGYNLALDRIAKRPREVYDIPYIASPQGFYKGFFEDIVGVSHIPDSEIKEVHVRAHSLYIYKLMETKKIHPHQESFLPYGQYEDGEYGEFVIRVEINKEFIGRILQMGAGLEVVAPEDVRSLFKKEVDKLAQLYNDS